MPQTEDTKQKNSEAIKMEGEKIDRRNLSKIFIKDKSGIPHYKGEYQQLRSMTPA